MKKIVILTMLLLFTVQAQALTANEYWAKRTFHASTNRNLDPLYELFGDVDSILGSDGELSTARILFTEETGDPTATEGTLYYNASSELLRLRKSGSWVNVAVGSGTVSLNVAYGNGVAITVDNGAVTMTATDAANNAALAIVQSDTGTSKGLTLTNAGTGNTIDIQNAQAGTDIEGTDDKWNVATTGVGTFLSFVLENGGIINNTENNEIEFIENSEQFSFAFNGNTLTYATDSGIDSIAFGVVDDLSGIASIAGDAGADFALSAANTSTFNFTIAQTGTGDNELRLTSAGTAANAIALTTATGGITNTAADDFVVVTTDDVLYTVGDDLTISGATGGVFGIAANAAAQLVTIGNETGVSALHLLAGTGDIDIQGVAASTITIGDAAQTAAITIGASTATMTDLSLGTGVGAHVIHIGDGGTASQDLRIGSASGASPVAIKSGTGDLALTSTDDITLTVNTTTTDNITLTNTPGTAVNAIAFIATVGGITHTSANVASTWTHTANGAGDDLSFIVAGAFDGSLVLSSAGTEGNAIDIDTTAGGIDIDMSGTAAGEDFSITTSSSVTITTSEAVANQFKVDATGAVDGYAINFETTEGGILLNADHSTKGDIELNAHDDIILTMLGSLTITNTGPMTVSGTSTLTGAVTATAGIQMGAVSRQPTADGTGTGTVATGTSFVTIVDPTEATDWMFLPSPVAGTIVWMGTVDDAAGFEVRTNDPATVSMNGVVGAGKESAIPATASLLRFVCVSANDWIGTMWDASGTEAETPTPD